MVIHVGIDPCSGEISIYDTFSDECEQFKIAKYQKYDNSKFDEIFNKIKSKFDEMFNEIKSKTSGKELGCACICSPYFPLGEFHDDLIDSGLLHGFKKVQIIYWDVALIYAALIQSKFTLPTTCHVLFCCSPNPQDIRQHHAYREWDRFLCCEKTGDMFIFKEVIYIWSDLDRYLQCQAYKNLQVIFYGEEDHHFIKMKRFFPHFYEANYKQQTKSYGAVCKARIIGNDPKIKHYNVDSLFGAKFILKVNEFPILRADEQNLPLFKKMVHVMPKANNTLTAISSNLKKQQLLVPYSGKILILLEMKNTGFFSWSSEYFEWSIKCLDTTNYEENNADDYHDMIMIDREKLLGDIEIPEVFTFPAKIQINDEKINAVGIDLGTTRCCAAVNRRNGIELVALENTGGRLLPSYISYDEERAKCGQIVIDRLRSYAKSSVFDVKRLIGKTFDEIKIDKCWPYEVAHFDEITSSYENGMEETDFLLKVKGLAKTFLKYPEEISADLLKHIKSKAEEFQGQYLTEVVITVPAAFNKSQNQATYIAAKLAGWKTIHLLPEPVAAAFAYFIDRPIPNNSNVLVFDLGGGTLDVCIFKVEKNQLKIISRNGDPNIGGRDFDNLIVKYFEEKLIDDFNMVMTEEKRYKLLPKCQNIKETLSLLDEQSLDADAIDPAIDEFIPITRTQFKIMSQELILQIRLNVEAALDRANFKPDQISKVLQVGGGCRMPMIKDMLNEMFPNSEVCAEQNMDEVVAVGAAYYAYYLKKVEEKTCSLM